MFNDKRDIARRSLGPDGPQVSEICLGTMTWGEQNTQKEAHQQLDYALDRGINFIDTAEMYPVPPKAETYGKTEEFIGAWPKLQSHRDKIILASKIVGPMSGGYVRDGHPRLNKEHIQNAVEDSLKRLNVEYLDLYQLHWPERSTNFFGKLNYEHHPENDGTPLLETLQALAEIQKQGKIRHVGISNETAWGAMKYLQLAEKHDLPRMVSIQNPYNLLNRTFEVGLAEVAMREQMGLLAYSPMAFGALSGKYLKGQKPPNARLTLYPRFQRYNNSQAQKATEDYVHLAQQNGFDPAQMALKFVYDRPFVTSTIIGATTMEQLEKNIDAYQMKIDPEVYQAIEAIFQYYQSPSP